jgi:hypothetical protein
LQATLLQGWMQQTWSSRIRPAVASKSWWDQILGSGRGRRSFYTCLKRLCRRRFSLRDRIVARNAWKSEANPRPNQPHLTGC